MENCPDPTAATPGSPPPQPETGPPVLPPIRAGQADDAELEMMLHRLENERHEDRDDVLALMELEPGMSVADVGCGAGYFTFSLSEAVGETGQVHAVDVNADMIQTMHGQLYLDEHAQHRNIQLYHSTRWDTRLPQGAVDVALMAHLDFYAFSGIYEGDEKLLDSVARALKPGGRLVVVQHMGLKGGGLSTANIKRNVERADLVMSGGERFEEYNTEALVFERPH